MIYAELVNSYPSRLYTVHAPRLRGYAAQPIDVPGCPGRMLLRLARTCPTIRDEVIHFMYETLTFGFECCSCTGLRRRVCSCDFTPAAQWLSRVRRAHLRIGPDMGGSYYFERLSQYLSWGTTLQRCDIDGGSLNRAIWIEPNIQMEFEQFMMRIPSRCHLRISYRTQVAEDSLKGWIDGKRGRRPLMY